MIEYIILGLGCGLIGYLIGSAIHERQTDNVLLAWRKSLDRETDIIYNGMKELLDNYKKQGEEKDNA